MALKGIRFALYYWQGREEEEDEEGSAMNDEACERERSCAVRQPEIGHRLVLYSTFIEKEENGRGRRRWKGSWHGFYKKMTDDTWYYITVHKKGEREREKKMIYKRGGADGEWKGDIISMQRARGCWWCNSTHSHMGRGGPSLRCHLQLQTIQTTTRPIIKMKAHNRNIFPITPRATLLYK